MSKTNTPYRDKFIKENTPIGFREALILDLEKGQNDNEYAVGSGEYNYGAHSDLKIKGHGYFVRPTSKVDPAVLADRIISYFPADVNYTVSKASPLRLLTNAFTENGEDRAFTSGTTIYGSSTVFNNYNKDPGVKSPYATGTVVELGHIFDNSTNNGRGRKDHYDSDAIGSVTIHPNGEVTENNNYGSIGSYEHIAHNVTVPTIIYAAEHNWSREQLLDWLDKKVADIADLEKRDNLVAVNPMVYAGVDNQNPSGVLDKALAGSKTVFKGAIVNPVHAVGRGLLYGSPGSIITGINQGTYTMLGQLGRQLGILNPNDYSIEDSYGTISQTRERAQAIDNRAYDAVDKGVKMVNDFGRKIIPGVTPVHIISSKDVSNAAKSIGQGLVIGAGIGGAQAVTKAEKKQNEKGKKPSVPKKPNLRPVERASSTTVVTEPRIKLIKK